MDVLSDEHQGGGGREGGGFKWWRMLEYDSEVEPAMREAGEGGVLRGHGRCWVEDVRLWLRTGTYLCVL